MTKSEWRDWLRGFGAETFPAVVGCLLFVQTDGGPTLKLPGLVDVLAWAADHYDAGRLSLDDVIEGISATLATNPGHYASYLRACLNNIMNPHETDARPAPWIISNRPGGWASPEELDGQHIWMARQYEPNPSLELDRGYSKVHAAIEILDDTFVATCGYIGRAAVLEEYVPPGEAHRCLNCVKALQRGGVDVEGEAVGQPDPSAIDVVDVRQAFVNLDPETFRAWVATSVDAGALRCRLRDFYDLDTLPPFDELCGYLTRIASHDQGLFDEGSKQRREWQRFNLLVKDRMSDRLGLAAFGGTGT